MALWCTSAAVVGAEPFGQFGYGALPTLEGVTITKDGIRAKGTDSDLIAFDSPLPAWRPVSTSAQSQTVGFGRADFCPSKGEFATTAPGGALYFPDQFRFRIRSLSAPYLTWEGGTVSNGVPAPPVRWIVLSFRDSQPSIILGFPTTTCSPRISGKAGNWVLESGEGFAGWVRFGVVSGTRVIAANSAARLGELAQLGRRQSPIFVQRAPALVGETVQEDNLSVTTIWRFDRPFALLPEALRLAPLGGYRLKTLSKVIELPGRLVLAEGKTIKVRFPVRRLPRGRAIGEGEATSAPIASLAAEDTASVSELALECLSGAADEETLRLADGASQLFLSSLETTMEPVTGQALPYGVAGERADITAAHALLQAAIAMANDRSLEESPLLVSLAWRQDASRWTLAGMPESMARKAAALASIAGAISDSRFRRLRGAMFEAGLAADRGREALRFRQNPKVAERAMVDPFWGIRKSIYGYSGRPDTGEAYVRLLLSPLRTVSSTRLRLLEPKAGEWTLAWEATSAESRSFDLMLPPGEGTTLTATLNLATLRLGEAAKTGLQTVQFAAETTGECRALLKFATAPVIPKLVEAPRFSLLLRERDLR